MTLAVYQRVIDQDNFVVTFRKTEYKIKNFNLFSWIEIFDMVSQIRNNDLDFVDTLLPEPVVNKMSYAMRGRFIIGWLGHAGISLSELIAFVEHVDKYDREIEYDLRKFVNIPGILGLLKMYPVEAIDVFMMLANREPNSWIHTKIRKWDYPFGLMESIMAGSVEVWTGKAHPARPSDISSDDFDYEGQYGIDDSDTNVSYDELVKRHGDLTKPKATKETTT